MANGPRYRVQLDARATRELRRLAERDRTRVLQAANRLGENPRHTGVTRLSGVQGFYRVRVGDFRLIFQINDDVLLVMVVSVGKRGEIYRNLDRL